jgi:hypothetical protein
MCNFINSLGRGPGPATHRGRAPSEVWNLVTTANFDNGGEADVFRNADNVAFQDGALTTAIVVATNVAPGSMQVSAVSDYQFTGPGGIATSMLTVSGGGTTELANSGNALGSVNILAGRLIISGANNDAIAGHVAVAASSTLGLLACGVRRLVGSLAMTDLGRGRHGRDLTGLPLRSPSQQFTLSVLASSKLN